MGDAQLAWILLSSDLLLPSPIKSFLPECGEYFTKARIKRCV
jgi:hypothetical protein